MTGLDATRVWSDAVPGCLVSVHSCKVSRRGGSIILLGGGCFDLAT